MEPEPASPKVFISYSHDSPDHEARVLELSDRLRKEGIDTILDQYESFPTQGWIPWMKHHVRHARFVIVVCTETYCRRATGEEKPGTGLGATYESQLIQQFLYNTGGVNERFIPVVLTEGDRDRIPIELQRYNHYGLYTETGYEDLYRVLTDQPKVKRPDLGLLLAVPARLTKADFRNSLWNVAARNPFFTGRETHLNAIHKALTQTNAVAVGGLGGIGKTQTAIEYAHRYRDSYQAVLWSSGESSALLLAGFAVLANLLNLPQANDKDLSVIAGGVRVWLESNPGWLLILDNVEDLNLVRPFLPSRSAGHVLMTTRLQATGASADLVELQKMEPEEGALFLLRRAKLIANDAPLDAAPEVDQEVAERIAKEVDGLPLALDQAGAFIEETPSTPAEYLDLYQTEGARLRNLRGELATDHASVTVTFSLAFSRLEERNPVAADLLRASAFLAPDAIPEEIFTLGGSELGELLSQVRTKPVDFTEVLKAAGRLALLRRNAANKSFDIHRLVQEVLKDNMDEQTARLWARRAVHAVNEVFSSPAFENWARCERLLPHAKAATARMDDFGCDSPPAGRLLDNAGMYLLNRGGYEEAERLLKRSLAIREKALGDADPDTATSFNDLARVYHTRGHYEQAEPLYQRALAVREKALGADHSDTASSLNDLAALYADQGRYEQAEPFYRRALAIREKALGADHPDTASSLNNLAALYRDQGRYEQAVPLLQRALAIREKALGADHPDTATSLNNLATLYSKQGRYEQAEPLYQRALAIKEKAVGADHPDTATSLNNLAALYENQGRYQQAEPLCQRALAIQEKALGADHPDTAVGLNNLAALYSKRGRYKQAEPLCRRALAILEKTLGADHPTTTASLANYIRVLRQMGWHTKAKALQRARASKL